MSSEPMDDDLLEQATDSDTEQDDLPNRFSDDWAYPDEPVEHGQSHGGRWRGPGGKPNAKRQSDGVDWVGLAQRGFHVEKGGSVKGPVVPLPDGMPLDDYDSIRPLFEAETVCDTCGEDILAGQDRVVEFTVAAGILRGRNYCNEKCHKGRPKLLYAKRAKLPKRLRAVADRIYHLHRNGMTHRVIALLLSNQYRRLSEKDVSRVVVAIRQARLIERHKHHPPQNLQSTELAA